MPYRLTQIIFVLGCLFSGLGASAEQVLPSETCRGLFIVPVAVGEQTTLDLVFDTGASRTHVDPGALAGLVAPGTRVDKVRFKKARIGGHEIGPLRASVHSMQTLGRALGRPIDGILGFPAFRDVLLTLDYPAEEIRVAPGRLPRPDGREIFRALGSKRPYLEVDVGGRRLSMLVDSGSAGRFRLKPEDSSVWSVPPRPVGASVLFASVVIDRGGRLGGAVRFGPLRFDEPVVSVSTGTRLAGWHVLRHFELTFDQKKKRIRMRPSGTAPIRLAERVGSGMAMHPRPEGLEILKVLPDTSAEAAGLLEGDLVVAIDGTPVYERGCRDPEGDPAGRPQTLSYVRDGVRAEVEVRTEVLVP